MSNPAEVVTPELPDPVRLTEDQDRRVTAVKVARQALQGVGMTSRSAVDPIDLVQVARYIETGVDPWGPRTSDDGPALTGTLSL